MHSPKNFLRIISGNAITQKLEKEIKRKEIMLNAFKCSEIPVSLKTTELSSKEKHSKLKMDEISSRGRENYLDLAENYLLQST